MRKSKKHTRHGIVETPPTENQNSRNVAAAEGCEHPQENASESQVAGAAGLSVILSYMVTYFSNRTDVDDLDVLSFSLHHLFCRVDYLYRLILPQLLESPSPLIAEHSFRDELLQRQAIWTKLRSIKYAIGRMEPLCNLLSDATRCMLDALDTTDTTGEPSTEVESREQRLSAQDAESDWLQVLNHQRWHQALTALTDCLRSWQAYTHQSLLFANSFAQQAPSIAALSQLDEAFSIILDSTGAIFGDILPNFQAISAGDDEVVATLLFDLMQQADRLLLQFDLTMEPLHALIEHFALLLHR